MLVDRGGRGGGEARRKMKNMELGTMYSGENNFYSPNNNKINIINSYVLDITKNDPLQSLVALPTF